MDTIWPQGPVINPEAQPDSLEAKQPYVDNGLDVVDPSRYYSLEYKEKEWERLWTKVWLIAGVESDIPEPGDYLTFEVLGESFIVTRDENGAVKTYYNVCPHRGNRLALNDFGSVNQFTCAFHSWSFGLDGKLRKITDRESFRPELVCHNPGLQSVRTETCGGIIFINMDDDAEPLEEFLGPLADYIRRYHIEDMYVVRHVRSEWGANWKTGVDAFYESYHLHAVHPQTQGVMGDLNVQYDLYPNGHSRMIVPLGQVSPRAPDQESVNEGLKAMMREAGIDPDSFQGTAQDVRRAMQKSKRERARKLGLDYSELTDGQLTDSWATGIFPNVQIGLHAEGAFLMRFMPHPTDPDRFFYDTMTLFRPADDPTYTVPAWMGLPEGTDTSGAIRPDIIRTSIDERPDLGEVLDQDAELLPVVQQGIKSRAFKGPLWGDQEQRLRHFHKELDRYISGEK
ncbi:MAG: aromatic ring-hydroxylating dioxygenase subunit alpha [Alphaproteobacteria bacterium]|nr:MAG: aromatic ring-hydroxylating dioxygenase subunit alpha [Alphaproteobacteria bacterium]